MKQILRIAFVIVLSGIVLTACKKDKSSPKNYLKVDDVTKALSQGEIDYMSAQTGGYWLDLYLMTSDIAVGVDGYWTGTGSAISFSVNSTSMSSIPSGIYEYYDGGSPYPTFTWDLSHYCLDWASGVINPWIEVVSGTLTVVKDGDKYTINFTGVDDNGDDVKLNYTGTLMWFDFSLKKASVPERQIIKK